MAGLIEQKPSENAWIAGEKSKIIYEVRKDDGMWSNFLNAPENQNGVYVGSMCCVSFSFNEGVEVGVNYLIETYPNSFNMFYYSLKKDERLLFDDFLDSKKEFNLSDRALGKLSGTGNSGNTLERVAETGSSSKTSLKVAIPQKIWDFPNTQRTPVFDRDDFFADIPKDLVKKYSDVFFKVFKVNYEFISTDKETLKKHLKQCPIQITVACCNGWSGKEVNACGNNFEHAILLTGIDNQGRYLVRDSFADNNDKILAPNYRIGCAMKILVNYNTMTNALILKKKGQKDIVFAYPVESEEAMSSYLKNAGLPVPTKEDGKIDWSQIKINGEFEV